MIHSWRELSQQVEAEIAAFDFSGKPNELYDPIGYTMTLGGKRIRPTLCLLAAQLFGGDLKKAMNLAMAVEVFHNFTLVHDDIMDEAPIRRGKPSVHAKWNRDVAILSGDVMFVQAYQLLAKGNSEKLSQILSVFNQTAIEVCEGQQFDMNFETRNAVTATDYIEMIRLKTAVLLACSLQLGAFESGASDRKANLIYEFGEKIGIAFQIQDDFLDCYANPEEFGKRVGGDIISNKKTFLMLTAVEKADKDQLIRLEGLMSQKISDDDKVAGVLGIYNELDIPNLTRAAMQTYFEQGMHAITQIEADEELKKPLISLAEQLMNRKH
ncbi:MAG: polyprenyl synthetase family protein [Flavobacteriales bacterium]|nr:polyprenyl synthetase family protein [Flavobacteriales bacterium]